MLTYTFHYWGVFVLDPFISYLPNLIKDEQKENELKTTFIIIDHNSVT